MRPAKSFLWVLLLPFLFLSAGFAQPADTDDDDSEITIRVARISFERGDVQIKRGENKDWERAALNLPVVEGDEITTGSDARIEIQFSRDQFLRLAENSYLKIITLNDKGVALSLSEGKMSVRLLNFDKDKEFFEIDAPKTTVSLQKAGMYRVDAGAKDSKELLVTATNDGQARIYSEDSGFILKSGRSTKIFIDGDKAGENETADASAYMDEWDTWVLERDTVAAKNLQQAHYDKYYDQDMYGAEDLDSYGEWINTKKYGHVWRPFKNSVASYADWSPYRYGQWRWVPPYGWTWVNDEPWGWATYHHGRWVYENGDWVWTPYPSQRPKRSWWKPALVVIVDISNDICWYPLPYDHKYRNYNRYSRNRNDDRRYDNHNRNDNERRDRWFARNIPRNSVVAAPRDRFGNDRRAIHHAPVDLVSRVLSKDPAEIERPSLPRDSEIRDRRNNDVFVQTPRFSRLEQRVRTGAGERRSGAPLDEELRRSRNWGNRQPVQPAPSNSANNSPYEENSDRNRNRRTGAFERSPRPNRQSENTVDNNIVVATPPQQVTDSGNTNRRRDGGDERRRSDRNRSDNNVNQSPSEERRGRRESSPDERRSQDQPRREERREERQERRQPTEPRTETPRVESPRQRDEPKREEPKREEHKKEESPREKPPEKVSPKEESPKPRDAEKVVRNN
jgi:hypothetical protein